MNAVLGLNSIGVGHNDVNPPNIMVERKQATNNANSYLLATVVDLGTATVLAVSLDHRPVFETVAGVVVECIRE